MNAIQQQRATDFRQMVDNGVAIVEEIEIDAQRLAEKMQRIHGGEYRAQIDHETGFILVRPK